MNGRTMRLPRLAAALAFLALGASCQDNDLFRVELGAVGVVTGDFDSVENILLSLEVPYTRIDGYIRGPTYDLADEYDWASLVPEAEDVFLDDTALDEYDVIFLDCGMRGSGEYVYNDAGIRDDQIAGDDRAVENLREYVEFGGQVYASDWAYELVERAFPDMIDFFGEDTSIDAAQVGAAGTVVARVVNEELREHLELPEGADELNVVFNNGSWAVMSSAQGEVLISADVTYRDSAAAQDVVIADAPLLVAFDVGQRGGRVIYTAFHNDAQPTDDVLRIIEYLVLMFQREGT